MPLSSLQGWDETARDLHHAAQLLGMMRSLLLPHEPNYLELALKVVQEGLSSGKLPGGGEVVLDFQKGILIYHAKGHIVDTIPLAGHSQATLLQALLKLGQSHDLADILKDTPSNKLVEKMTDTMKARGHSLEEVGAKLAGNAPLKVDATQAGCYGDALDAVFTGIARFRAGLGGHMTPVVVWPEHFDMSTLWFMDADMDEHKAHLNFGFAPFSPGFESPYLYAYAYPYPPNMKFPELPAPAYWHREGWTGVVVKYEDIARQADPAAFVETMCEGIFAVLRPLLG